MQRKAQVTLFLIMGGIVLGMFFFMSYINQQAVTSQIPAETQKMVTDVLASGALNFLVTTCLEEAVTDGVGLVGLQGGNIYTHQNGSLSSVMTPGLPIACPPCNDTLIINGDKISTDRCVKSCKVGYGILSPQFNFSGDYPPPPAYPGKYQVPLLDFSHWGRFGDDNLRSLCDSDGANAPWVLTGSEATDKIFTPTCLMKMYSKKNSTQEQLQTFVRNRMATCVDWDEFEQKTGFVVNDSEPNVTIRYGPSNVYAMVSYPITALAGGVEPVVTIVDFEANIPVRLKTLAEYSSFLASYDSFKTRSNSTDRWLFDLGREFRLLGGWDSFINVTVEAPLKHLDIFDDVVSVTDSASRFRGGPYTYQFARRNRYPALDYIGEDNVYAEEFDIVTLEGNTILIDPFAVDPDEDPLNYFYFGWKETDDSEFDYSTGQFSDSNNMPREWTNSPLYVETGRAANFTPQRQDIGPHNLTVFACDEFNYSKDAYKTNNINWFIKDTAGIIKINSLLTDKSAFESIKQLLNSTAPPLCDWQTVRVMVFDIPRLNASTGNYYDDIPDSFASIEDHYYLDASGTYSVYTPFNEMIWTDILEEFEMRIPYDPTRKIEKILIPPNENITSIEGVFPEVMFEKVGEHEINFTVDVPSAPTISIPVQVKECLPHRNPNNPFPYPYQNYYVNDAGQLSKYEKECSAGKDGLCENYIPEFDKLAAFQANHACCDDGGVYYFEIDKPEYGVAYELVHNLDVAPADLKINVTSMVVKDAELKRCVNALPVVGRLFPEGWLCIAANNLVNDVRNKFHYRVEKSKEFFQIDGLKLPYDSNDKVKIYFIQGVGVPLGPVRIEIRAPDADPDKWGTIDEDAVCFKDEGHYGGFFTIKEESADIDSLPWDSKVTKIFGNSEFTGELRSDLVGTDSLNDLFKVERVRKCGNSEEIERGNVCAGDFVETLKVAATCPDLENGELERCQGTTNQQFDNNYDLDKFNCEKFSYSNEEKKSFEYYHRSYGTENANGDEPTGICNDQPACSSNSVTGYGDGGDFPANASGCSEGGCTLPLFEKWDEPGTYVYATQQGSDIYACSYRDGTDGALNFDNPVFYCDYDSTNKGATTSSLMSWHYSCDIGGNFDGCKRTDVDISSNDFDKRQIRTNADAFLEACDNLPDTIDYVTFGESTSYMGAAPAKGVEGFCGDNDNEYLSYSFNSKIACCDRRDGADNSISYECVDSSGYCTDTESPNPDQMQLETGNLCWDNLDNDCDGYVDFYDGGCKGYEYINDKDEYDSGKIMCGNDNAYCRNNLPSAVDSFVLVSASNVDGYSCLRTDISVSNSDNFLKKGLCDCNQNKDDFTIPIVTRSNIGWTILQVDKYLCLPANKESTIHITGVSSNSDNTFSIGNRNFKISSASLPSGVNCELDISASSEKLTITNKDLHSCVLHILET